MGFALSYRNFNQIGDIQFTNHFDTDIFSYSDTETNSTVTNNINTMGLLCVNTGLDSRTYRNMWIKNREHSKQYQVISGTFNGRNRYFEFDVEAATDADVTIPHFRVYKIGRAHV